MSENNYPYSLLAPGPVNIHPDVQKILSLPMIHHRTPQFDQILKKVFTQIKEVFETKEHVFIQTTTGSGGMEALMTNALSVGDQILIVDSGKFGERWVEMAKSFSLIPIVIKTKWGEAVDVTEVEKTLLQNPNCKAVFCQACETSTGVAHPIEQIGKMIYQNFSKVLFMVDGITAVGAIPLKFDDWHIDGIVAGSQKAFMLPTGLSFICFSKKAWDSVQKSNIPKFYLDLRLEKKANDKGETFFSSPVPLIRALDKVLDLILQKGLAHLHAQIRRRADFTRHFVKKMGLSLYAKSPSDSLTAFLTPDGVDSQKIREELEKKYNITIMGGQDQAKGKILRIGHMGYILDHELVNVLYYIGVLLNIKNIEQLKIEMIEWLKKNSLL